MLPAMPAIAASSSQATKIELQGTILLLDGVRLPTGAVHTIPTPEIVRLITATGVTVDLTGAIPKAALTGSTFSGIVSVPQPAHDQVVAKLRTMASTAQLDSTNPAVLDSQSAAAADIVAAASAVKTPLAVSSATVTAPKTSRAANAQQIEATKPSAASPQTAAGTAGVAHTLNIAVVNLPTAPSDVVATDAQVANLTTTVSDFWTSQSAGKVAGMTQLGSIQRFTSSNACAPDTAWEEAAAKFSRSSGSYWAATSSTHLVVVAPQSCSNSYAGLGTVGNAFDGGLVWLSYAPAIVDIVMAHEVGHNLSMRHANVSSCTSAVSDGTSCTDNEYADYYDVMGAGLTVNGAGGPQLPALNINQRDQLGSLTSSELVPVTLPTGSPSSQANYSLAPVSNTSGARGLKVTDPQTQTVYYVEYRNGTGMDTDALYTTGFSPNYGAGVRVLTLRSNASSAVVTYPVPNSSNRRLFLNPGESINMASGTLSVKVLSAGNTATVQIALGTPAADNPVVTAGTPTVSGTPTYGSTLTASPGSWTPTSATIRYQWLGNNSPIAGATANTYTLVNSDIGHTITVAATGTATGYTSATGTSAATSAVTGATMTAGSSTIHGDSIFGSTLTASSIGWTPANASLSYQWLSNEAPITGATGASYVLGSSNIGQTITVSVTGAANGYAPANGTTAATAAVTLPPSSPVYRFWSSTFSTHFYTIDPVERDNVIRLYPGVWSYEGPKYNAFDYKAPGTVPLYRFWSDTLRGHFYTADPIEKDRVIAAWSDVWNYEKVAYWVYPGSFAQSNTAAVTRFWSPVYRHHFYTADPAERDAVISRWPTAWSLEGPKFRVPSF